MVVSAARFAGKVLACLCFGVASAAVASPDRFIVTTHHYDNFRTGWNRHESILMPASVAGGKFGLLYSVPLDEQVNAQPLLMTNERIGGRVIRNVVYVATENNTIYAINAATGRVLLKRTFGEAVPQSALPGRCNNNAPNVGITSTPVIDAASNTMYLIAYRLKNGAPEYRLHAIALDTLAPRVPTITITASATLADGSTYTFDPAVHRQRAALLLANGNIYAGFASFCDVFANQSRGWVMGWRASTLQPLSAAKVTDIRLIAPHNTFLSSVWMSGNGLAADQSGNVFFTTGNTDRSGTTYNATTNPSESVLELSGDLSAVQSYFTPLNANGLDEHDGDFASGGVMLIPPQEGASSNLAVAAGKFGTLYLLDADDLGNAKTQRPFGAYPIGQCWCGESYFRGPDGIGRIVSSGGNIAGVWRLQPTPTPNLVLESQMPQVANGQDPGFFTSVSSNGIASGTAIVWAVGRPTNSDPAVVDIYAFDAANGSLLYTAPAGTWPNTGGDSDIVPVVANGRVYVASEKSLAVFGRGATAGARLIYARAAKPAPLPAGEHEIYALVRAIAPGMLSVQTRSGDTVRVNTNDAIQADRYALPTVGRGVLARGWYDSTNVLHANTILHAKDNPALWFADR